MIYSRTVAPEGDLVASAAHVRHHLASVADPDDDPSALRDLVNIDIVIRTDGSAQITGTLDAEPNAPYLRDDYDPDRAEAMGL